MGKIQNFVFVNGALRANKNFGLLFLCVLNQNRYALHVNSSVDCREGAIHFIEAEELNGGKMTAA